MRGQELRELGCGCPFAQKECLSGFNLASGRGSDAPFLRRELQRTTIETKFHALGDLDGCTTVGLAQEAILLEPLDIAANCHDRDTKFIREGLGLYGLMFSNAFKNQLSAFTCQHVVTAHLPRIIARTNMFKQKYIDEFCCILYTLANNPLLVKPQFESFWNRHGTYF